LIHIGNQEFEQRFLLQLNPQQRAAVTAVEGNILLLATPGSGKTTVLVTRLGYMICNRGVPPESILTMTYTKAATRDMKNRFVALFGEEAAANVEFRTINGVSARIIQRYCALYNRRAFSLLDNEGEQNQIIRSIYQRCNDEFAEDGVIRDIKTQITYIKNRMLSAEEIAALKTNIDRFQDIYKG
jgi:DNA helicase-2/ATP-dependent DNA helicase PcrA